MNQSERRLAAIMFTDLVGFSALSQQNEAAALSLLDTKKQFLSPLLEQHKGALIKTMGDGFLVEFSSAVEAVQCAVAIQNMLHGYNTSQAGDHQLNLRIGIHLGDVEFRDNDVFGDGVNIASRIEPLAEPGGVCISDDVARQVRRKLDIQLISIGEPDLKNISESIEVFKIERPKAEQLVGLQQDLSKSIAVLPFDNLSTDADNEFFSDGLTEDILTKLSKVHDLKVISRTSVMQYKGVKRNLREIGEELNVGVVVEGSVRKAANQVRITAQLIDARTDEHLWAESYDRELSNIFEVQSDVAQKIVEALQVNVSATEQHQIKSTQTENTEAYQLYLQGREYWDLRSEEDVNRAIDCFNRAIEIDPSYALAYVGLADCHTVLANNLSLNTTENFAAATSAIEKALSLDDELGEAYTSDAQLKMRHYDWENAESSFKRAISLNPNYATAHLWYGLMLAIVGRTEEATKCFDIAIDLDPNSFPIQLNVGQLLLNQRKFEEAEQAFRAINENSPGQTGWCAYYLGLSLFFMDRYDEAAALFEKSIQNFSSGRFTMMSLSTLLAIDAIQGDLLNAYKKLAQLLELQRKSGMVSIYVGWAYDALGERELALDYFEEALEEQYQTIHWVNANPLFDQFRDEPRFQEILKKMRLLDD